MARLIETITSYGAIEESRDHLYIYYPNENHFSRNLQQPASAYSNMPFPRKVSLIARDGEFDITFRDPRSSY